MSVFQGLSFDYFASIRIQHQNIFSFYFTLIEIRQDKWFFLQDTKWHVSSVCPTPTAHINLLGIASVYACRRPSEKVNSSMYNTLSRPYEYFAGPY